MIADHRIHKLHRTPRSLHSIDSGKKLQIPKPVMNTRYQVPSTEEKCHYRETNIGIRDRAKQPLFPRRCECLRIKSRSSLIVSVMTNDIYDPATYLSGFHTRALAKERAPGQEQSEPSGEEIRTRWKLGLRRIRSKIEVLVPVYRRRRVLEAELLQNSGLLDPVSHSLAWSST